MSGRDRREFVFDPAGEGPVADAVELTSRKWTRAILERLVVRGDLRYNELAAEIDGISDKMLSESLERLEAHNLVRREVVDDRPVKVRYSLTEAGAALEPVMEAVATWAAEHHDEIAGADTE
jgi:DNA-binding HxlR family transcriptional regulator